MGKRWRTWLAAMGFLALPIHIAPDSHAANTTPELEHILTVEAPVTPKPVDIVKIPFEINNVPLDYFERKKNSKNKIISIERKNAQGKKVIPHMAASARMHVAIQNGWERYYDEQNKMQGADVFRDIVKHQKRISQQPGTDSLLNGEELVDIAKFALLESADEYGRVTFNSRRHGHKEFTPEVAKKHNLDWTDCTRFVFEAYSGGYADSTILDFYMEHVGDPAYLSVFPRFAAKEMKKQGFEAVYIAVDTKGRYWNNRYYNGMSSKTHAKPFFQEVKNDTYYVDIDYVATDYDAYSSELENFLTNVQGILNLHEAYHYTLFDKGTIIDAKYNNNPYMANNLEISDLLTRMRDPKVKKGEQIKSFVLFVPKGSVERYIYESTGKIEPEYFVKEYVPKDIFIQDSIYARKE